MPAFRKAAAFPAAVSALEPEWKARFESRSYGFRPGRSCQDAVQATYVTARGATCKRVWALDADLAAAFDRIDHSHLLDQLGTFPARGRIAGLLRAGVMDHGRFAPTERGSPQGGVISPVLMNVALHGMEQAADGMEQAAGVRYIPTGSNAGTARPGSPVVIRYADDVLTLCHSREQAEQVKAWLRPRGLVQRLRKRRGPLRAQVAVQHKILTAIWHISHVGQHIRGPVPAVCHFQNHFRTLTGLGDLFCHHHRIVSDPNHAELLTGRRLGELLVTATTAAQGLPR